MSLGLSSHTSSTRLAIFLDKFAESGPGIVATDEVGGLILTGMSREDMIVLVAEDLEPEVISVRNINEVILSEKTICSNGPSGLWILKVGNVERVGGDCGEDVGVELLLIHND